MSDRVFHETDCLPENIQRQIEQVAEGRRKVVRHGGLICSKCRINPPGENDRYCPECRRAYRREWGNKPENNVKALRNALKEHQKLSKGKDNGQDERRDGPPISAGDEENPGLRDVGEAARA